jgi:hypothetical protein
MDLLQPGHSALTSLELEALLGETQPPEEIENA